MALTRATAESILVGSAGGWLEAAGLDGQTVDGTNGDLNWPLGWALLQMGREPADLSAVSDDDLSGLSGADVDQFLALAEYRLLVSIRQNYASVDVSVQPASQSLGQLGTRIDRRVQELLAYLRETYSYGIPPLEAGVISLDFQAKSDDSVEV